MGGFLPRRRACDVVAAERSDSSGGGDRRLGAGGGSRLVRAGPVGVAGAVQETALVFSARRSEPPPTYLARLRAELEELHLRYRTLLDASSIHNVDPNRRHGGGMVF